MDYANPELRERLAAEYALGTLRGPARARLKRLMRSDAGLCELVEDWELRLGLLAAAAPAEELPAGLWDRIAPQIEPLPTSRRESRLRRFWDSLGFWRGVGAVATAAAAAMALYVALRPSGIGQDVITALDGRLARIESATQGLAATPGELASLAQRLAGIESRINATNLAPTHVAVLIDMHRRPMMTAELNVADARLSLQLHIKPPRDFTGKILEVWITEPDGPPRSLGLFPSEKGGTTTVLVLSHYLAQELARGGLEVSLEPSGGSTTGAPSGPVLFSGAVLPVDL